MCIRAQSARVLLLVLAFATQSEGVPVVDEHSEASPPSIESTPLRRLAAGALLVDVAILVLAGYFLMKRRAEVRSEKHTECHCAPKPQVDKISNASLPTCDGACNSQKADPYVYGYGQQ